jgi:outer membrane protein
MSSPKCKDTWPVAGRNELTTLQLAYCTGFSVGLECDVCRIFTKMSLEALNPRPCATIRSTQGNSTHLKPSSFFSTLVLGSFGFLFAHADTAFALNFVQAWEAAVAKDPQLAMARLQQEALGERVNIARSGLAPFVAGTVNASRQKSDTNQDPTKSFSSQTYGLNLTYPLYRVQAIESLEQSKLVSSQSALQTMQAEQELILRVAQAYTDVLAAQDSLRAAQTQRRAAVEQYQVLKKSFDAGAVAQLDLQDAMARSDIAQAQELAARNDFLSKRASLQVITGLNEFEMFRLRSDQELPVLQPSAPDSWVSQARTSNLQVQQIAFSAEIAKREISKQNAGHKPTVDLVGAVGRTNNASASQYGINQNNYQLGIQINIPIYSGGGIEARTREAIAQYRKSNAELDAVRDQAEQVVRQALIRIQSGRALVKALSVAVQSSRNALELTRLAFNSGAKVNLDVLNAQQQLFITRRDLARASYDYLIDGLKLKQAVGSLKIEDLAAIDSTLVSLETESIK